VGKGQNNEIQEQVNNAYDVIDFDPDYLQNRKRLFDCLKQVSRGLKPNHNTRKRKPGTGM